jgi:hypothetical protein
VVKPHFDAMATDLTAEYADKPEWAYVLGVALGMSVLLGDIEDAADRGMAVLRHTGYALRPVT